MLDLKANTNIPITPVVNNLNAVTYNFEIGVYYKSSRMNLKADKITMGKWVR